MPSYLSTMNLGEFNLSVAIPIREHQQKTFATFCFADFVCSRAADGWVPE